jgi:hypothetical protein
MTRSVWRSRISQRYWEDEVSDPSKRTLVEISAEIAADHERLRNSIADQQTYPRGLVRVELAILRLHEAILALASSDKQFR